MPVPSIDYETAELQMLDEIRDWHRDMADALLTQRASVQQGVRMWLAVSPRFFGMTDADVEAWYDTQRRELDRLTVLNLVASAEASVKIDYFRRIRQRLKDPLALAYRKWHNNRHAKKQFRPDFDEQGILDVLKNSHVMDNNIVGQFRECLRARHWLGHGRYWAKPVQVDGLDPDDVYDRASTLLQAMPA